MSVALGTINSDTVVPEMSDLWRRVLKTADQTKASDTTLANDNTLTINLAASTRYTIRARVFLGIANAAMDYKYQWNYSGTTSGVRIVTKHNVCGAASGTDNQTVNFQNSLPYTSGGVTGTTSGIAVLEMELVILTNSSGTFAFQWAQNSSDAANMTVYAGSYLEYLVVA